MMLDIPWVLPSEFSAQASQKVSNRKYLLKVAQTMIYDFARPGSSLKEDGNEIDSNFAQLLLKITYDPNQI